MTKKQANSGKIIDDFINLKRLWPFIKVSRFKLIVAAILVPIISITQSSIPLVIKWIIDNGILKEDADNIMQGITVGLLLIVTEYFVRAGQTLLTASSVHLMIRDMRQFLVRHILRQSASFHDKNLSGALVTRATSDFDNLSESLNQGVLNAIVDLAVLAGAIGGLLMLNWKLAACALILLPGVAFIVNRASRHLKRSMLSARSHIAGLNAYTQECLYNFVTLKLLNGLEKSRLKFTNLAHKYRNAQMKSVIIDASLFAFLDGISSITIGIILWFAVSYFLGENSALSAGVLIAFVQYVQNLFDPLKQLGNKIAMLQGAFTALDRIFKIIDTESYVEGAEQVNKLDKISFRDVSFSYSSSDKLILKNVNFDLNAGESLALVGRTGSGKSTIIKLISKLYGSYQGSIRVNNQAELRSIEGKSIREYLAIVPQDITMFAGSIIFNITFGQEDITLEQVIKTSKILGLHQFISSLPEGYDTVVNEKGSSLSHGQKQLIVFARAMVKDPKFIILDEATSAVDPESERLIQTAIDTIMKDRTVIVIAHRLSTIEKCDSIILLNQGEVIEQGSHLELMRNEGSYFRLQTRTQN